MMVMSHDDKGGVDVDDDNGDDDSYDDNNNVILWSVNECENVSFCICTMYTYTVRAYTVCVYTKCYANTFLAGTKEATPGRPGISTL